MRTPAGMECKYYYEDFNRGRDIQECRLVDLNPRSEPWRPNLCRTCPVPAILRGNACPNMVLGGWVGRRWLLIRQVRVAARCTLTEQPVVDPMIGCGQCHEARWRDTVGRAQQED